MKNLLLILSFLLIGSSLLFSQPNGSQNLTPPSPDASALGRYAEVPTNNYTGVPNISIPLHELNSVNLSIPISMSYHAGGIRVDEVSGWTGLGWSLNAGGVITRSIRGIPDERNDVYGYNPIMDDFAPGFTVNDDNISEVLGMIDGNIDGERDLYHFNINGISGKFVFDWDGTARLIPHQDVKIERPLDVNNVPDIKRFILTTQDGTKYHFGGQDAIEWTAQEGLCSGSNPGIDRITAWYITKIESPISPDEINFTYGSYNLQYATGITQTEFLEPAALGEPTCNPAPADQSCINSVTTNGKFISQIRTENFKADFTVSRNREDVSGSAQAGLPVQLDRIDISTIGDVPIKSFDFAYDYYVSTGVSSVPCPFGNCDKRLRLLSITENSSTGNSNPPYEFTYNSQTLPHRLSFAQDHWGFYNGANSNPNLLPQINGFPDYESADRRTNPEYVTAGILEQITYPTGGTSTFLFEANTVGNYSVSDVEDIYYIPQDPAVIDLTYDLDNPDNNTATDEFFINAPQNVLYNLDIGSTNPLNDPSTDPSSNTTAQLVIYKDGADFCLPLAQNTNVTCHTSTSGFVSVFLQPGHYQLIGNVFNEGDFIDLTIQYSEVVIPETSQEAPVGGLRIASMNTEGMTSSYSYTEFDNIENPNKSSGRLVTQPKYNYIHREFRPDYNCVVTNPNPINTATINMPIFINGSWQCAYPICSYNVVSSSPRIPLGTGQGSHITYKNVAVTRSDGGKSEYTYTNIGDTGGGCKPPTPSTSWDWQRGLLLYSKDYKLDNNGYTIVREIINEYDFREDKTLNNHTIWGLTIARDIEGYHPFADANSGYFLERFTYNFYRTISQWYYLKSTTEILDGVEKVTNFEYNPTHLNVIESSFENSDGKEYKTNTFYATKNNGIVPIRVENRVAGQIVSGNKIDYTNFGSYERPAQIFSYEGGWHLEKTIHNYTGWGKPLSMTQNGWATENYTWNKELVLTRKFANWEWEWKWYDDSHRQLKSFKNMDGQLTSYTYDDFQRLDITTARNGEVLTDMEYSYNPNQVTSLTDFSDATDRESLTTFDGLGRMTAKIGVGYDPEGNSAIFEKGEYDGRGRNTAEPYMIGTFYHLHYERSILNRVYKKYNPDGNFKRFFYECNESSDVPGYDPCELYKHTVFDENGNPTTTFMDKVGRTVAVRDALNQLTTYTYEDDGDLIAVTSPAGAFGYTYDQHHRVTSKSIPGAGETTFGGYDDRDLLGWSVDANGNETINIYNVYGQLEKSTTDDKEVDSAYEFDRISSVTSTIIDPDNGNAGTTTQSYSYDSFGRVIGQSLGALSGQDDYSFTYDAADNLLTSERKHAGGHSFKMEDRNLYDHSGRLLRTYQGMDGGIKRLISANAYTPRDELAGRSLYSKNGGSSFLQTIGYGYNTMGWLTGINGTKLPEISKVEGSCGLPSGPNEFPYIDTEVNLDFLLDIINDGDDVIIGDDPCDDDSGCDGCPDDCVPDCTPEVIAQQQTFVGQYLAELAGSYGNFDLPANLLLVQFCDDQTLYMWESELEEVPGEVIVLNTIYLDHQMTYEIYCEGEQMFVAPGNLLYYRSTCEEFLISEGNCEATASTQEKTCNYRIELRNMRSGIVRNSRTINVFYDKVVSQSCFNGDTGEEIDEFIKEEKQFTFQATKSWRAGNIREFIFIEPGDLWEIPQNTYLFKPGGYIKEITVQTFNPDGQLRIVLDPNTVLQYYPNLIGSLNVEHLRWYEGATNNSNMKNAIEMVVDEAIKQWAIQNDIAPNDVLYEFSAYVRDGAVNQGSQYGTYGVFNVEFMEFRIVDAPGIGFCGDKANLVYVDSGIKEKAVTYISDPFMLKGANVHKIYNYASIECGYVSTVDIFTFDFTEECGSLNHRLRTEVDPNDGKTDYVHNPRRTCVTTETVYSLECGPTIQVCNGEGCFDCTDTTGEPTVTHNPNVDPCEPTPPNCTPEETQAQAEQVEQVLTDMENINVADLEFPVTLVQVMLCDGSMIWVLEDFLETLDTYTWITTVTINSPDDMFEVTIFPDHDLFGIALNYYSGEPTLEAEPYKNGNVSWMKWKVGNQAVQHYGFRYDELDRLKNAKYYAKYLEPVLSPDPGQIQWSPVTIHQNRYNVFDIGYDGAGNISGLSRNGFVDCQTRKIDALNYVGYNGNQLMRVEDSALERQGFKAKVAEYDYDANGNLMFDTGKGIDAIHYNFLNLPRKIETEEGIMQVWYDASGAKQKKSVSGDGGYTKEYANGVEYKDGELEAIYTPDGRIIYEQWDDPYDDEELLVWRYRYEFTITDHLGNARVSFSDLDDNGFITWEDDPATEDIEEPTEVLQENHYYPFGMNMEGAWQPQIGAENQYQYNGKELNTDLGIDLSDYGARYYDAAIGRWTGVDPLAGMYIDETPYGYTANNPIKYFDPNGMYYTSEQLDQMVADGSAVRIHGEGVEVYSGTGKVVKDSDPVHSGIGLQATPGLLDRGARKTVVFNKDGVPLAIPIVINGVEYLVVAIGSYVAIRLAVEDALADDGADAYAITDDTSHDSPVRVALGTDEDLANFSTKVGAAPYGLWGPYLPTETNKTAYIASLIALATTFPKLTFHFNLSDGLTGNRIDKTFQNYPNKITTAEYLTLRAMFMDRTTFYEKSGTIYKEVNKTLLGK